MRNDGKENQQRKRVSPPENSRGQAGIAHAEGGQVGHHQQKNQQRDKPRLIRDFVAEPAGTYEKPANE